MCFINNNKLIWRPLFQDNLHEMLTHLSNKSVSMEMCKQFKFLCSFNSKSCISLKAMLIFHAKLAPRCIICTFYSMSENWWYHKCNDDTILMSNGCTQNCNDIYFLSFHKQVVSLNPLIMSNNILCVGELMCNCKWMTQWNKDKG